MDLKARLEKLRRKFAGNQIDALFVSEPSNLYYLSGCEGLEGYLLVTGQKAVIATDFRYTEQARKQSPGWEVFRISGKMAGWLPELVSGYDIRLLGFESSHLPFSTFEQMTGILKNARPGLKLVPVSGLIESLRAIKEPEEIARITRAARITDSVLEYLRGFLKPGLTEKELAWIIEKSMRENGSQPVPFPVIVAAGPHAALPHHVPSDYVIRAGEPIIVDTGSKYEGYGSDLTRTFYLGPPEATFQKVYDTVLEAQQTAISRLQPGMTGAELDSIAREIISRAGYGEAFGHGLGHGLGLVTHEMPHLSPNSTDVLTDGMVFTIEPGIYLSGWGGVRIEDDIAIENGKIRVISSARK